MECKENDLIFYFAILGVTYNAKDKTEELLKKIFIKADYSTTKINDRLPLI